MGQTAGSPVPSVRIAIKGSKKGSKKAAPPNLETLATPPILTGVGPSISAGAVGKRARVDSVFTDDEDDDDAATAAPSKRAPSTTSSSGSRKTVKRRKTSTSSIKRQSAHPSSAVGNTQVIASSAGTSYYFVSFRPLPFFSLWIYDIFKISHYFLLLYF